MRIEYAVLEEKLVKANKVEIGWLSRQISKDPELYQMLMSPMEKIPQYHYQYSSESHYLGSYSLLDTIRFMIDREHRANLYFSKIGLGFTGFIVYEDNGKVINHVKMASFRDDRKQTNPAFAKDLIEFVLEMAPRRDTIEWLVDPANTEAICQYNALLDRKNFNP
jgi:hypothetical protein